MSRTEEIYVPALGDKKVPILTLDNKWHQLFTQTEINPKIQDLKEQINELLKRQGKLTTETKEIKKIKTKLMNEIVELMDSLKDAEPNREQNKKLEDYKRLINDCNEKVTSYQDELLDIPKELDRINYLLMLETMEVCYQTLRDNTAEIDLIDDWVKNIRVELKKKLIHKQEKEMMNQELYTYMHNIFGANVIEIFDMKYNPSEKPIRKKEK